METKDDVLRELLRPMIEDLVSNALNAYLSTRVLEQSCIEDLVRQTIDACTLEIHGRADSKLMKELKEGFKFKFNIGEANDRVK
jgi:hypothetical protein